MTVHQDAVEVLTQSIPCNVKGGYLVIGTVYRGLQALRVYGIEGAARPQGSARGLG